MLLVDMVLLLITLGRFSKIVKWRVGRVAGQSHQTGRRPRPKSLSIKLFQPEKRTPKAFLTHFCSLLPLVTR